MAQDDVPEVPDPVQEPRPHAAQSGRVVVEHPSEPAPGSPVDPTASRRPPAARQPDDEARGTEPHVAPTELMERTERTERTEAAELVEPVEPAEPAEPAELGEPAEPAELLEPVRPAELPEPVEPVEPVGSAEGEPADAVASAPTVSLPRLPGDPDPEPLPARTVARGRLGHAMRPRATRGQLLAALLCALLGFALVVQARQTQTQGLDSLRQADLVRLLDNVTNAEARAEQDVRDEQAIRDRLLSGSGSSAAAQEAAQRRLDTLGILAGTVPAAGPGIELEITDPRRQVDAAVLLDTLEELRDGGAEVIQIGSVRVVAATAFTDEADGVRVDGRVLTPPYTYKVIGDPQTLSRLLQIPGGVLDVLHGKGAQGKVSQPPTVTVDALRSPTPPQYARPAPAPTP
jgi:uncharacterized protein YlxW (UPF0749 family)